MQRFAHKFRLKPGASAEEYKRRHDEIWPEMTEMLNEAGMHNFSIWNTGDELFMYYECEDRERADFIQNNSEINKKWDEYMDDLIELDIDPKTNMLRDLRLMFYHK